MRNGCLADGRTWLSGSQPVTAPADGRRADPPAGTKPRGSVVELKSEREQHDAPRPTDIGIDFKVLRFGAVFCRPEWIECLPPAVAFRQGDQRPLQRDSLQRYLIGGLGLERDPGGLLRRQW